VKGFVSTPSKSMPPEFWIISFPIKKPSP